MDFSRSVQIFAASLLLWLSAGVQSEAIAAHAQAMGYTPKYPAGFSHFDYINPDAPRGGELVLSAFGSFDSLNPYVLKGLAADGLGQLMFETLMAASWDEPFSQYGLLADDAELAEDGLSVTFRLNPEARFYDGTPVTPEDVKFSFDILKGKKAHPQYRIYWADLSHAMVVDSRHVRFEFARVNPELHLIAGQIPIFSRNWIGERDFDKVVLDLPVTSGPYLIDRFELGKYITFRRNPDYWAKDLNVRRGMFNFEKVTFKYYRDSTVALEAFKAGEFEFISVFNSKQWARDYVGPKFENNLILKDELKHSNNAGMQGFVFNIRRPKFQDKRVRRAITLAMDFEWSNRKLFYNQYLRCDSYFSNSELASRGIAESDELRLLEPFREQLPKELFTAEWQPPSTAPLNSLRSNLRMAKQLLAEAGWHYRDGALRNDSGEALRFDVMLAQKGFERILASFARNLGKLGIEVDYRTVDVALYQRRADTFDFDMMVTVFGQSQSPGNELISMFHSSTADQEGSRNLIGISDPVIDAMIEKVIYAEDRKALVTAVHALDRVLLHGEYLVPNWYIGVHRIAYWDRFAFPEKLPLYYDATEWLLKTAWKKDQ
jgi:microcin C transport system substrate-binding protein